LGKLTELGNSPDDIKAMSWGKARWNAKGGLEDHEYTDWIEAEPISSSHDINASS